MYDSLLLSKYKDLSFGSQVKISLGNELIWLFDNKRCIKFLADLNTSPLGNVTILLKDKSSTLNCLKGRNDFPSMIDTSLNLSHNSTRLICRLNESFLRTRILLWERSRT